MTGSSTGGSLSSGSIKTLRRLRGTASFDPLLSTEYFREGVGRGLAVPLRCSTGGVKLGEGIDANSFGGGGGGGAVEGLRDGTANKLSAAMKGRGVGGAGAGVFVAVDGYSESSTALLTAPGATVVELRLDRRRRLFGMPADNSSTDSG